MTELPELEVDTYDWLEQFDQYDPVLTSNTDPHGPIGNNSAADVIDYYRQWRYVGRSPKKFRNWMIRGWDIDPSYQDFADEKRLAAELPHNHFHILTWDDVVIAIAFSQFFVDGKMLKPEILLAINAIRRQRLDVIMAFRGWSMPEERLDALDKMKLFIDENGG